MDASLAASGDARRQLRMEVLLDGWPSTLIGFGGFFIAALSLILSYRDRRAGHREFIYEKQVNAYAEVISALDSLYDQVQNYIFHLRFNLNSESRKQLRIEMGSGAFQKEYRGFLAARRKWSLYLPATFLDSLTEFMDVLNAISAPDDVANQYPSALVHHPDPAMPLSKAYRDVVTVARHGIGVESLSKDLTRVFGDRQPEKVFERYMDKTEGKGS